jgi:hypothetical protein
MATIRKRRDKWQVQIRRKGQSSVSKSFNVLKDAKAWARQLEIQADRSDLPADPKALERITLRGRFETRRSRPSSVLPNHQGREKRALIRRRMLSKLMLNTLIVSFETDSEGIG